MSFQQVIVGKVKLSGLGGIRRHLIDLTATALKPIPISIYLVPISTTALRTCPQIT